MNVFLYNIFVYSLWAGMWLISPWNKKACAWLDGREAWKEKILGWKKEGNGGQVIWMHCASLGEFEQGRPVLEGLAKMYPGARILLTFFSPSGFEIQKNYTLASLVCYLPLDTPANARWFLDQVNPTVVLWIKYEYWYHLLKEIHHRKIPALLVSAVFMPWQNFFKWYGKFWRNMLHFFDVIFVQDKSSLKLLQKTGYTGPAICAGDTRFDRVLDIAQKPNDLPGIFKEFCNGEKIIIAGSTWPEDEKILLHYANINPQVKLIIAPHQVDPIHMEEVNKGFRNSILYSRAVTSGENISGYHVLIIDNIGMLSVLYQYADITYIGGGFGDAGIHNTLEAAVFGKPVIFGPEHEKFTEAFGLMDCGGAFTITNALELEKIFDELLENNKALLKAGNAAGKYVSDHAGATKIILDYVEGNRLMIN
ncbi:MAG: glycosyltransferase N-terminal domain-containing protein [Ferruginibacter sp.]